MSNMPLMKCGHTAQGTDKAGKPACIICLFIHPGAREVEDNVPDITGRKARCSYYRGKCKSEVDSSFKLAFFEHRPNKEFDLYYCGCFGWD